MPTLSAQLSPPFRKMDTTDCDTSGQSPAYSCKDRTLPAIMFNTHQPQRPLDLATWIIKRGKHSRITHILSILSNTFVRERACIRVLSLRYANEKS